MADPGRQISALLSTGAEYLVIGEIIARTGLLASQAPRNNKGFDIIVNTRDLKKGCRVEVKHSRTGFKDNITHPDYDFLVFIYAPSEVTEDDIVPTGEREIYVFPRSVVEATPSGKTGNNFNPKYIDNYQH